MGFRDLGCWNLATISKLAWHIANGKENMWVKWVHSVYIKETNWSEYVAPTHASWRWRLICRTKNTISKKLQNTQWLDDTKLSIKVQYQKLQDEIRTQAPWVHPVWNRYSAPKHRFILWLVVQNRLKPEAGLCSLG